MNEASSKYVDQLATERLLLDKLRHVHHAPDLSDGVADVDFADFARLPRVPQAVSERRDGRFLSISYPSALRTRYEKNNQVQCRCCLAGRAAGDLILVHGLYEDNLQIHDFLIRQLNELGLNVYLLTLPFHYGRKPDCSAFSGEYFWSGNTHRNALAYKQAVYDLHQLYQYVRGRSSAGVWIAGFSMGGGIALSLAAITRLDGVFAINPVCNIAELVWTSRLFSTICADLRENGISFEEVAARYRSYDPLNASATQTDRERIVLASSLYDQINSVSNYERLIERWGLSRVLRYEAGHLNILRVPRLARDIARHCLEGRTQ